MPRKPRVTNSSEQAVQSEQTAVAVPPKATKASRSVKAPASVVEAKKSIEQKIEVPDVSDVEDTVNESDGKKSRTTPEKESIVREFDELITVIDAEIVRLRESQDKAKGVKFLRSLCKSVKTLRGHSLRVMKQKHKTNRKNNTNSGFLKPVHISKEMAKFTGWSPDALKSRVDVTKYICNYIKENNLQNPSDRRQIVADKKLSTLLDFKADKDDKPLTYYRIQTFMKKHFTNPTESK